ncbi:putative O-methyltransferase [Xylariaceae sp. FL0594]|nr:putative O-methyltransferase [Xylariaceae sp. FL0594]
MASNVEDILARIQAAGAKYSKEKNTLSGARDELIRMSRRLIASLELPSEAMMRMGWAEPALAANCRIAVDLGLFHHLKEGGRAGVTVRDLAARCKADEELISRIMRHFAAMNLIRETEDEDTYTATGLTDAFTDPRYEGGHIMCFDIVGKSFQHLPTYLKSTTYTLPPEEKGSTTHRGPFQAAHDTDLPFFAWLDRTPPYLDAFNSYMSTYRAGKRSWAEEGLYPVSERLIEGFDPSVSDVFLVDVGGGRGHDLLELRELFLDNESESKSKSKIPGKLILQDRPGVIASINKPQEEERREEEPFEAIPHDFFTPQPARARHARAYYLHSILHNWSDADCVSILRNIRPAMKPGYSRLLINELVIPSGRKGRNRDELSRHWPTTALDQVMLVLVARKERTREHFKRLLDEAGFRLVEVYSHDTGHESLIEAEVLEDGVDVGE